MLLVKLADRLHNMRTLEFMPPEKRARIAEETMDIYAPLAGRMGMQDMREELEELSFRHINAEAYETVSQRLSELSEKNRGIIRKIESELGDLFEEHGLDATVTGRQKKPYSVFRKMQSKSLSFEQLSDIYGFRIIVKDPSATATGRWASCTCGGRSFPGASRTISRPPSRTTTAPSTPPSSGRRGSASSCRSAPTACTRSPSTAWPPTPSTRMWPMARASVLPHDSNAYSWLRRTIEQLSLGDNPEEFLEHTKLELFHDQVFCFTPKGQLIALPRGATPIDFAYAVHTDIGDTCVGAKINGRIMPLVTQLNNGDEVEIIRSGVQVPPAAWEKIVVTGKARAAIRRATRAAVRKQYSGLGYRILERAFNRAGQNFSRDMLQPVLHRLGFREVEDAIAAVGRGELASKDVLTAVYPDHQHDRGALKQKAADEGWFNLRSAAGMIFRIPGRSKTPKSKRGKAVGNGVDALPIRGAGEDMSVSFGAAGAVPGDRIIGIMEPGKGITIYPIQSPMLTRFDEEPERWIDVRWDLDEAGTKRFHSRISLNAINEPGTLAEVAQTIAASDANIRTLSMVSVADDFTEMNIDLEVWDLKHLNKLITALKGLSCISSVSRLYE